MGVIYQQNGDREKALANMEKVLEIAEKMDDKRMQSFILRNLGHLAEGDDPDKAHAYFKRALSLAEEISSTDIMGSILGALANYNMNRIKDYDKAMEYAKRALGINKTLGDVLGEYGSLKTIGSIYAKLEDYKQALDYYNQAYELMKDDINKTYTIEAFFGLSEIYVQLKDYDKALDYLTQAMMMSEEIADNQYIVMTFWHQGNLYATMGDYDSAIEMANSGKSLSEELVNKLALVDMLALLGEIHDLKRGETDIGLDYYNQVLELIKEVNPPKASIANNLISIGWVYSTKGDYKIAAEQYLEKALEIKKETGDDLGLWGSLCLYLQSFF
jgi:tetratricopeptide (TPR) repeat protein